MADRTPTRDRTPVATAGWRNVDGNHVSAEDAGAAMALNQLAAQATRLARSAPGLLAMMRDNQMGQPQAAHYGAAENEPDPRAQLWCWEHEQNAARCDQDRDSLAERGIDQPACRGDHLGDRPSDPAGNAAMVTDKARQDHDAFVAATARAVAAFDIVWRISTGWPATTVPDDADAGPGEELCRAHYKCNKYPEPITRRTTGAKAGQRYYRYLCKWCGEQRKALGGDKFDDSDPAGDPPAWYVEHHINRTLRAGMAEKAQRQVLGAWERTEAAVKARAKKAAKKRRK